MPRVIVKTKNRAGAHRHCGKCDRDIWPGEKYKTWSFRYGGTYYRCNRPECAPRPSDLTQSKMAEVYSAVEDAEENVKGATSVEEVRDAVSEAAERVREVASEYYEASEPFGYQGENAERSDEVGGFADELESFYPEDEEPLDDVRDAAQEALSGAP